MPRKRGKNQSMIVAGGEECKQCKYMSRIEGDKNQIICSFKNKKYFIGQYTPCDGASK